MSDDPETLRAGATEAAPAPGEPRTNPTTLPSKDKLHAPNVGPTVSSPVVPASELPRVFIAYSPRGFMRFPALVVLRDGSNFLIENWAWEALQDYGDRFPVPSRETARHLRDRLRRREPCDRAGVEGVIFEMIGEAAQRKAAAMKCAKEVEEADDRLEDYFDRRR